MSKIYFLLILPLFAFNLNAKTAKSKKLSIDGSKNFKINYPSSEWNKDAKNIDSAFLFLKDKTTGALIKIILDETEPDSSVFSGRFSLGKQKESVKPLVYIPPKNLRDNAEAIQKFSKLLRDGKIKKKPLVFRRKKGNLILDIYDTKQQAKDALKAYKAAIALDKKSKSIVKSVQKNKKEKKNSVELEKKLRLVELKKKEAQAELSRIQKEQLAKQEREKRIAEQKKMAKDKILANQNKAKQLVAKALKLYAQKNYVESETKFKEATELDPENKSYYFQYGITQYRNKKYNDALVTMQLDYSKSVFDAEKSYYMGLIHFKLKELRQATEKFAAVKEVNHESLSPSAAFYKGICNYVLEKYDESQADFEWVIDNSKNPKLDDRAEEYLDKIAAAKKYKKLLENPHYLASTLGIDYDSNVLLSPDGNTSQGASTNVASARFFTNTEYSYRLAMKEKYEWNAKASLLYYFSADNAAASADLMDLKISAPYTMNTTLFGKPNRLTFDFGYDMLYMDTTSSPIPSTSALNAIFLNTNTYMVVNNNWHSQYNINIQNDDADNTSSNAQGDDDPDALKAEIGTNHYYFLDNTKKRAVLSSGGVTLNNAKGKNTKYTRIDLGIGYQLPFYAGDYSWTNNLNAYSSKYSSDDGRTDTNVTFSSALSKSYADWIMGGLTVSYTSNSSTVASESYSKYNIMLNTVIDYSW
ncbi:cell envelope integrity protein TolA [bacterium]|nr:cell envelope integrity protein TolA [bacterium]